MSDPITAIKRAETERWVALVKLADTVKAVQGLPEEAPKDALIAFLDEAEAEYVAAYRRREKAIDGR